MAAKKKTTKKAAKKAATRRPAEPSAVEASLKKLEERIAALEAQGETSRELRELRLSLLPTLETYRNNVRIRGDLGVQMPWVLSGTIVIILIVVGVLASNGSLSGDAAAVLITGTLIYAFLKLREFLLD